MIVLYGLMMMRPAANDAQQALEIICFVGGLILCFLAVVLARLGTLLRKLENPKPPGAETTKPELPKVIGPAKR